MEEEFWYGKQVVNPVLVDKELGEAVAVLKRGRGNYVVTLCRQERSEVFPHLLEWVCEEELYHVSNKKDAFKLAKKYAKMHFL